MIYLSRWNALPLRTKRIQWSLASWRNTDSIKNTRWINKWVWSPEGEAFCMRPLLLLEMSSWCSMWIMKGEQRRLSISGLYCTVVLRVRERCGQVCAHQTQPCVRFFSGSASLCSGNVSWMRGSGWCAGNGCCLCCWLSVEDESPLLLSLTAPLRLSTHAEKSVLLQPDEETLRCRHRRYLLF